MFEEYGLVLEKHKRYYKVDLTNREYFFENTVPYKFSYKNIDIRESTWGSLLVKCANELIKESNCDKQFLLDFKTDWTKTEIFTVESRVNYKLLDNGLYVNCNHTSLHACWLLRDILILFNIDLKDVIFLIKRYPNVEPKEIRDYFISNTKELFKEFLIIQYQKSGTNACIIADKQFDYINKYQSQFSKSFDNFYLIDDYSTYNLYYSKFLQEFSKKAPPTSQAKLPIVKKALDYLKEFYKKSKY